jgi:hypothetical protein
VTVHLLFPALLVCLCAGPARCLQALLIVAAFLAVEVNVFFLKYALWVPPTNPLNTARLVLWLLVGAPAVREYYEFIEVRRCTAQHSTALCCFCLSVWQLIDAAPGFHLLWLLLGERLPSSVASCGGMPRITLTATRCPADECCDVRYMLV